MNAIVYAAAAVVLLSAGGAQAQSSPPASPVDDLTRALNGAPAAAPAVAGGQRQTPAAPPPNGDRTVTTAPRTAAPPNAAGTTASAPPPAASAAPPAPTPRAAPTETVLDAAARAVLPFTIDLPPGFRITTGRPGPDFKIYTVRRGDQSFARIYAGPSSQFPIYSGEMAETTGRASIIATQDGVRHAMEHLFQRDAAPREIHVWIMSLEGADQALAERIAQTVDPR